MAPLLDQDEAGSLGNDGVEALEAHMLVCDECFAAYVALLVRRA